MYSVYCVVYLICLKLCVCALPQLSATESAISSTTEQQEVVNHSSDDLKEIKFAVKTLAEQFGKWNYIYLSQMDPKLVSSLTTLTNIDTNIKNLQERAHVWDTFQLHVAAWNDQLSTSDRKLDIISKAQEEILSLEGKLDEISNIEYKIDKILKKMETFEETLDEISKKVENSGQVSLFGEFATRGILSTLKSVEKKMDRVLATKSNVNSKADLIKKNVEDTKGKLTIKCNTPPIVEELLHDIASKVDVIFDKLDTTDSDNSNNVELENEDYMDDQNYINEDLPNTDVYSDSKLTNKVWKRTDQPLKQVKRHLQYLENTIFAVYNNTVVILENEEAVNEKYKKCSSADLELLLNSIKNEVKFLRSDIDRALNGQTYILENYFREQETKHNEILRTLQGNNNTSNKTNYNISNTGGKQETDLFEPDTSLNLTRHYTDKSFCDDIELGNISGVYNLANSIEPNNIDYTYYTRYCQIREDGGWTVIQNRDNYRHLQNFTVDWYNYKIGFGKLEADFWFGNDFIYRLSYEQDLILRIELEDFDGNTVWAEYNQFQVASENENYKLTIGEYQGNATDSFSSHNNSLFSTFDVKNDDAPECCPCAESYGGGWWFNSCFESNLNGVYYRTPHGKEIYRGIIWEHWLGDYSLKKTRMMVKRKNNIYDETTTVDVHKFLEDP